MYFMPFCVKNIVQFAKIVQLDQTPADTEDFPSFLQYFPVPGMQRCLAGAFHHLPVTICGSSGPSLPAGCIGTQKGRLRGGALQIQTRTEYPFVRFAYWPQRSSSGM